MDDNILVREATVNDIVSVVDFYMRLDNPGQKNWIEIMMDGRHPYIDASYFIIAEDLSKNKMVASVIYMPWTYSYGGCLIKAVRLEEVFCEPDYQNQGIVREILRRIAEKSKDKNYLFEIVYGTNSVYNHLGYTYGISNEEEGYSYAIEPANAENNFIIQEASDENIPIMANLYEKNYNRNLLATSIGEKEIYYNKNIYEQGTFYVIKSKDETIQGFFLLYSNYIYMMEIADTVSYFQIRSDLTNFFIQKSFANIYIKLGKTHPVYMVFNGLYQKKLLSECGFVKIHDIPKFLMGVSKILENRLAESPYAHFTGEFTIAMHKKDEAYKFIFKNGVLTDVSSVKQAHGEVDIERDRFIRLLFGKVSSEEINEEFSMYYFKNHDYRNIIEILFPKLQSHVVSIN
jgi:predicted acetyltransferase